MVVKKYSFTDDQGYTFIIAINETALGTYDIYERRVNGERHYIDSAWSQVEAVNRIKKYYSHFDLKEI